MVAFSRTGFCLGLLFLFASASVFGQEEKTETRSFREFNTFVDSKEIPENYATYKELKIWSDFQGLKMVPDNSFANLEDGMCRMIGREGFSFYLYPKKNWDPKEFFLVLDLTQYQLQKNTKKQPVRSLQIFLNGKKKKTIYFPSEESFPVVITVSPEETIRNEMKLELIPSDTNGRFWGIWDASLWNTRPKF